MNQKGVGKIRAGRWQRMLSALIRFKEHYGHCRVPSAWRKNRKLAGWVSKQRSEKREGKLSADRMQQLDAIGFVWGPLAMIEADQEVVWARRLAELVAFHAQHGGWTVPTEQPEYHQLRVWMDNQRINYHHGWLSASRIRRLEEIGFPWETAPRRQAERDARWERWLEKLVAFHREHGHWVVPVDRPELWALLIWLRNQRLNYRRGKLAEHRVRRLLELGVPLNVPRGLPPRRHEQGAAIQMPADDKSQGSVP